MFPLFKTPPPRGGVFLCAGSCGAETNANVSSDNLHAKRRNLNAMLELLSLAAFAGLLLYAAGSDAARLIIPNWVSIALCVIFLLAALSVGAPLGEVGMHVLFGFAVLA